MMIPIFLVSSGRSGTTYLMRLLASHPAIVAYEEYPLEFRPALFSLYPDYTIMSKILAREWNFEGNQELFYEPSKIQGTLPFENVEKFIQPSHARSISLCVTTPKNVQSELILSL